MDPQPEYTLGVPVPLPQSLAEREKHLLPFAQKIATLYGEEYDPANPSRQLVTARHASHLLLAHDMEGEPIGLYAYRIRSPENPEDKEFYENLSVDKLPVELFPEFLTDEDRDAVTRALAEIKDNWNVIEVMDKAIHKDFRGNGLSNALQEAATRHLPKERRIYIGDISTESSMIQRPKLGGVTYAAGEILEPDRELPLGLNEVQFKTVAQILAHGFTAHHYPFALEASAGETGFDKNAVLASDVFDEQVKMSNFEYAQENKAVPQIRKALGKTIAKQEKTGKIHSTITVTAVENPKPKVSSLPQSTQIKAA